MSTVAVKSSPATHADSDASLRLPVLLFFGSAIFWLVVGSFLAWISASKLVYPGFLDGVSWLTYGRLQPAADNIFLFGWASQAGIGAGLWILARLGRTVLRHSKLLVAAAIFWNIGVLLGVCGIVAGGNVAMGPLQIPGYASVVLFVAFACIGIWSIILLRDRRTSGLFVSQWYFLAAFLWFPWFFATAVTLLVCHPIQGSAQTPVAWWFGNNLLWLWLTPLAVGSAYFLIPQETRRPLPAYSWSMLAFWGMAFLGGWTGTRSLIGGPVPAWLVSAGVTASILMVIPVTLVGISLFGALSGPVKGPVLTFSVIGLVGLASAVVINAIYPLFALVTQFSDFVIGQDLLMLHGFISMVLIGAIYFILPRVLEMKACPMGTGWHFWLFTIGLATMVGCALFGGLIQGFALNDPGVTFASSTNLVAPFRFLGALGNMVFFVGCVSFAGVFVDMLLRKADVVPWAKSKGTEG